MPREIKSPASSSIPTLLERERDGLYLLAYCPHCNRVERAKVESSGQPRDHVASVLKIRIHLESRHQRELRREQA